VTAASLPVGGRRRQTSVVTTNDGEPPTRILVTNDDGVESSGLHALVGALVDDGRDVMVVAPASDMSGSGAAIGRIHLDEHIDAEQVELPGLDGVPAYAVDGPPGLCVLAARLGGFGHRPELVVSGINPGCNTGRAVLHSGTVGGALTAANFGGRGLAVSIDVASRLVHEPGRGSVTPVVGGEQARIAVVEATDSGSRGPRAGAAAGAGTAPAHWATAAGVAAAAVDWLLDAPRGTVLNLNVPDLPATALAGARAATLAPFGTVRSTVVESAEDGGRLQMELRPVTVDLPPDCDTALVAAGYVAVSALSGIRVDADVDVDGVLDVLEARVARSA
jgi:5'-nucleotidase